MPIKYNTTKTKKQNKFSEKISINGGFINEPKSICNAFNEYFVNVGNSLSNCIRIAANCQFTSTSLIENNFKNSFFLRPMGKTEVIKHINGLNLPKSAGKYGIPVKYIKYAAKVISPTLTSIYSNCISTGCFPHILKVAEIIPIYKAGSKNLCSNYRPI